MNFSHLLLTRFNLDFSQLGDISYPCDDNWHRERFKLFNQYCLPSVAQQTSQRFEWIIFFNEKKRSLYMDFIRQTEQRLPSIRFIFVNPEENFKDLFKQYIRKNQFANYLITTRLDNDDCIASHFMESVQKKVFELRRIIQEKDIIINPNNGYQFEIKFPFRKSVIQGNIFSPFLSLATRMHNSTPVSTVLDHQHHLWGEFAQSEKLPDEPFWTQIIHKKNRANKLRSLQLLLHISDKNFPVLDRISKNNVLLGVILLPLQYVITISQRIITKFNVMRNS